MARASSREPERKDAAPGHAPREAGSIAWAHLSDFHFKAGQDYGADEVLTALLDDLGMFAGWRAPERGAELVPLDFVVVTGDVAYGGKKEEYAAAVAYLGRLSDATGVPKSRIFLVPGNHDVDRERGIKAAMLQSFVTVDYFEKAWPNLSERRSLFAERLAAYRAFATGTNPDLRIPEERPGGFFLRLPCRGRTVALLGLGSSWLSGTDDEAKRLVTGKQQAYDLAGGVELKSLAGADLKLALMHHPLDWMREEDEDGLTKLLAAHADLMLRGHLHKTGVRLQVEPGRRLLAVAAGSAYAGSRYRNAYNVARVTFGPTRQLKLWLRTYASGETCFVRDVETYAAADTGVLVWDLDAPPVPALGPAPLETGAALRPYLARLIEESRYLPVRGVGAMVVQQMELTAVYTRLRVSAPGPDGRLAQAAGRGEKAAEGDDRLRGESGATRELRELLPEHQDLVLVGDPGSGKTTFLQWVALNLARASLGLETSESMAHLGLSGDPPFPLPIRLVDLAAYLRHSPDPSLAADSPELLHGYLRHLLSGDRHGLPADALSRRVRAGGCMLLLDGIDEVPGEEARARLVRIVERVAEEGRRSGNRHLVTSRTRAYQGGAVLGGAFARAQLAEFGDREIEAFVEQWAKAVYRIAAEKEPGLQAAARSTADDYRRELLAAVRGHPGIRPLTGNPLMLTVLAVVHWTRKRLPEQRAELYDQAVDCLLETRLRATAVPAHLRKEYFREVAVRMFEDPSGVVRALSLAEAARVVAPVLQKNMQDAQSFLEEELLYSGLLVGRVPGQVEFWHLTFQEYLAALGLSKRRDVWPTLAPFLHDDRWSEVVALLAGCLRRDSFERASDFIERILGQDRSLGGRACAVGLVGRILRDIRPYGADPSHGTSYAKALKETLAVFEKDAARVPEPVRVEVGEALGQAGDPRLRDPLLFEDDQDRVPIAGRTFWMGAQKSDRKKPGYDKEAGDDEAPVHRVTVSAFRIDRYPVTVQQFRRFVELGAEGYLDERFWDPDGWTWREQGDRTKPSGWEEQLRHPNRPVVRVTWYEAEAYCRWLSARTGLAVRLPTEAEWEYAARGAGGRKYPWGEVAPTDQHANYGMRVGHATPVGIYPLGATPEGVHDMAGNAWEWCRDWYGPYRDKQEKDPIGPEAAEGRLLRGGGFYLVPWSLRAAFRYDGTPGVELDVLGFRCVVAGAGGQED